MAAAALAGGDLGRQASSGRSWSSVSVREMWNNASEDVFQRSNRGFSGHREDDEEELWWAAIELLPTYDRMRKGVLTHVKSNGRVSIEGDAHVGTRALHTLLNSTLNAVEGVDETRLQLLRDASGAFRPGVLTALVGVSGAGKTTLMDVLSGKKTGGYIQGEISISGYPKNQTTFARVTGWCEQNDIHSPYVTVYESLLYSAWLRLAKDVKTQTRKSIPVWWTIYGIIASQFGDYKTELTIPGADPVAIDGFLKKNLAFDHDFLIPVVISHMGWVLLFFFAFAYGIKFLNFQRR